MLLRLALLLCVFFTGFAGIAAAADSAFDVGDLKSSADLVPFLRKFTTDKPGVLLQTPADADGKGDILELETFQQPPPFQWEIVVLKNKTTTPKNLVLSIGHQQFTGSRLMLPIPPGSVVNGLVQTGGVQSSNMGALGEDAFEIVLKPNASKSLAILVTNEPPSVVLWDRNAYETKTRSLAFFRGAVLGIGMLLALSMLLLYTTRARATFLSGGIFAAAAVAFMALEAGYFAHAQNIIPGFDISPSEVRAVVESLMSISLLLCLTTLSDLRRHAPLFRNVFLAVAAMGLALPVYGFVQPLLVSTIARLAFGAIAVLGFIILFRLRTVRPLESALLLWCSIVLWAFIAGMAAFSKSTNIFISPILLLGLTAVLIFMSFRFVRRAAGNGFLSQPLFQEAGRRGLALAGAQQYVWDWNPEDQELFVSEELGQALGHVPGTLNQSKPESLLDIIHPADRVAYLATLENAERRGRGTLSQELRLKRADGTYRWFELRARGMTSPDNRMIRCIGTLSDITNAKRREEQLLNNAVYDRVTGLPNRALFLDRLKREMVKQGAENLHVVLVDIDRFKMVNDGLGHDAGDSLLTSLGRRIEALLGPHDTLARFPGDQFAVLFAASAPDREIVAFTDQLRTAVARPIPFARQEIFLTACFGVASYRQEGLTAEQLVKDAAIALYEAKRRGKEMIKFFQTSMRDNRSELVALEAELRRALERNEIEVHYQPIARLSDMDLAGFEALIRWRHPVLGLLAPESFLGLAEQTGMIKDIGRHVLNEATRQLGIWQRAFRPKDPVFMAVNISASQLNETNLVSDIRAAINRETINRQTLKIEVTESVLMQFPEKAAIIFEQIKQLGVGLACDDFGTGYSSLSILRNLPFDTLKVDRSFIVPESDDERAAIVLEAIVALAHDLGMAIVAEGIEEQSQVDRLGALHCDYGQGFFIGQPMTVKQITESLSRMPYVKSLGKTTISTLWERATQEPVIVASDKKLTVEAISGAVSQELEIPEPEILAPEPFPEKPYGLLPPPGSSPMAPRKVKPEPVELPPLFSTADEPVKKPAKAKKKMKKAARPKKDLSSSSSVA